MGGKDNHSVTVRTFTGGTGEDFMTDNDYVIIYENTGPIGTYLPSPESGRVIKVVNATSSSVNVISQSQLNGLPGGALSVTDWAWFVSGASGWFTFGASP